MSGTLFVAATPIGNLEDISARLRRVLTEVSLIAAEDTRHTRRLLTHLGIRKPLLSVHEHNEPERAAQLVMRLGAGEDIALVSDGGTPLISDPGYRLVRAANAAEIPVRTVPGPSAVTAALSVAGLPTDRFAFEGFLPARSQARRERLRSLAAEPRTLVLFESPRRVAAALVDLAEAFGAERTAVLARELSKYHETVRAGGLGELAAWLPAQAEQQRGEVVLVIAGQPATAPAQPRLDTDQVLDELLAELPTKQAVRLAVRITGEPRNTLYRRALEKRGGAGR